MTPRAVLVLAILVAALAAFIWFFERDLPSSEELAERSRQVLSFAPEDVTAVRVEWEGRAVRLERASLEATAGRGEAGPAAPLVEWRLTEPVPARAERSLVEGLLTALAALDRQRTMADADRAEVGLAEPRGRVTVETRAGAEVLEVGADVPASENVLVALAGDEEVIVTRRSFLTQLEREPGEWRSKDVLFVAREEVSRLRLSSGGAAAPGEPVVLVRRDGRFYLEAPVEDLAAAEAVDRLLQDLVGLRAQRFLDSPGQAPPPPSELGLEPPRAVVVAELAERDEPIRVELGGPTGDGGAVYARVGGQLFETVTELDEAAARPAADWRSRSWTELRSFEIDRVEVVEPGADLLALARDGVDWRRGDDTIPYTAASDLLFALTEAEGELLDGAGPAGEPLLTMTLAAEEGDLETLSLYAARDDGAAPVRSSARDAVLVLPAADVAEVERALAQVRAAEPVAPPAADDAENDEAP